jgi:type I restriction-modification system DNA methylase subunit/restriction endonuclease S subunit
MLHKETKRRIDDARNILVGQLPLPSDQIELITIALIYKFMDDQDEELRQLGLSASFFKDGLKEYSWQKLMSNEISGDERVTKFINGIESIQKAKHIPILFRDIFNNTFLKFRDGRTLQLFLKTINGFTYDHSEELGNAFEYLLMVMGTQADNGQFRTPRNIIDFIVEIVDPGKEDTILDPACGTGGFLVSAYKHILRKNTSGYENYRITLNNYDIEGIPISWGDKLSTLDKDKISKSIEGYDITPMMVRLARVNLYLHHFANPRIHEYDTLSFDSRWKDKYTCILANPPFMTPRGFTPTHDRFYIKANKAEVLFSDYILEHLTPDGKAGFIVPEGIIFQNSGDYVTLRKWATEVAGLWAVVSLPANVFQPYSGVKTSILLFDRGLARQRDEILLLKIDNDGFSLNTNRTPIIKNDLPIALEMLQLCKTDLVAFKEKYIDITSANVDLKYKLLTRVDFARLDAYRATATAWSFLKKQLEKTLKAKGEANEKLLAETKSLAAEKGKDKKEKIKQSIDKIEEKLNKQLLDFKSVTGYQDNEINEEALKEWYNNNLKEPAISYGIELKKNSILTKNICDVLDSEREYNWNIDKYNKKLISARSDFDFVSIGDVCELINGRAFKPEDWETESENGLQIIRIQNLNNPKAEFNYFSGKVSEKQTVHTGDLLFSWSGSRGTSFGAHIWKGNKAVLNQHIFKVVHNSKVTKEYLYYTLNQAVGEIEENLHGGVGLVHITKGNLEKIQIPLPPISVQDQITNEINLHQKIINGCDLIIDNYKPVFEINEEWEICSLEDVCEKISDGTHFKPDYTSTGVKFLSAKNVVNKIVDWENVKYVSEEQHKQLSKRISPRRNDILLAKNGTTGIAAINDTDNIFDIYVSLALLRPSSKVLPHYLLFVINSILVKQQFDERLKGVGVPNLHLKEIKEVKIPVPPLNIQADIVKEMEFKHQIWTNTVSLRKEMRTKIQAIINKVWGKANV